MKICEGFVGADSISNYPKIRLSANGNTIRLLGAGIEGVASVFVPQSGVQVEKEGEVCLHHGKLQAFLQNLQGKIRFSLNNGYMEITPVGGSNARKIYAKFFVFPVQLESREEISRLIETPDHAGIRTSAEVLRTVLDKVAFCAAKEDAGRFTLKGVCIKYNKSEAVASFVALDGFKMGVCTVPVDEMNSEGQNSFSVVIPSIVIGKIISILSSISSQEEICMSLIGDRFCFWFPGHVISSRIADGDFPDVQNFFRSQYDFQFSLWFQGFRRAIKSVTSVVGEDDRKITFVLDSVTQELVSTCLDPSHGESWERVSMEDCTLPKESISIYFNTKHLLRILSKMNGESIHFFFQGTLSPFRIQEKSELDGAKSFYVLMPMKEPTPVVSENNH